MPLFLIGFRPIRYLLFVLMFGILRGAAHGDWQAWVILTVCAVLLWGHLLLDAARQLREAAYQARMFVEWAWGQAVRVVLIWPASPGGPNDRRSAPRPMRQRWSSRVR